MKVCPVCQAQFEDSAQFCPFDGARLVTENLDVSIVGATLGGRYRVDRKLGQGCIGTVYVAADQNDYRSVALKILNPAFAPGSTDVERLIEDARRASALSNPNLVPLLDSGVHAGRFVYLVEPLLEHQSLIQRLNTHGPVMPDRALKIAGDVVIALAGLHGIGCLHLDVKPHNVFVVRDPLGMERAVVSGVGTRHGLGLDNAGRGMSGACQARAEYLAPELVSAKPVDSRTDIYFLGLLLYEIITGRPPFTGSNFATTAKRHVYEKPLSPKLVRPQARVDAAVEGFVMRCLNKAPDARYGSLHEVATAIARITGVPLPSLPSSALDTPNSPSSTELSPTMSADEPSRSPDPDATPSISPEAGQPESDDTVSARDDRAGPTATMVDAGTPPEREAVESAATAEANLGAGEERTVIGGSLPDDLRAEAARLGIGREAPSTPLPDAREADEDVETWSPVAGGDAEVAFDAEADDAVDESEPADDAADDEETSGDADDAAADQEHVCQPAEADDPPDAEADPDECDATAESGDADVDAAADDHGAPADSVGSSASAESVDDVASEPIRDGELGKGATSGDRAHEWAQSVPELYAADAAHDHEVSADAAEALADERPAAGETHGHSAANGAQTGADDDAADASAAEVATAEDGDTSGDDRRRLVDGDAESATNEAVPNDVEDDTIAAAESSDRASTDEIRTPVDHPESLLDADASTSGSNVAAKSPDIDLDDDDDAGDDCDPTATAAAPNDHGPTPSSASATARDSTPASTVSRAALETLPLVSASVEGSSEDTAEFGDTAAAVEAAQAARPPQSVTDEYGSPDDAAPKKGKKKRKKKRGDRASDTIVTPRIDTTRELVELAPGAAPAPIIKSPAEVPPPSKPRTGELPQVALGAAAPHDSADLPVDWFVESTEQLEAQHARLSVYHFHEEPDRNLFPYVLGGLIVVLAVGFAVLWPAADQTSSITDDPGTVAAVARPGDDRQESAASAEEALARAEAERIRERDRLASAANMALRARRWQGDAESLLPLLSRLRTIDTEGEITDGIVDRAVSQLIAESERAVADRHFSDARMALAQARSIKPGDPDLTRRRDAVDAAERAATPDVAVAAATPDVFVAAAAEPDSRPPVAASPPKPEPPIPEPVPIAAIAPPPSPPHVPAAPEPTLPKPATRKDLAAERAEARRAERARLNAEAARKVEAQAAQRRATEEAARKRALAEREAAEKATRKAAANDSRARTKELVNEGRRHAKGANWPAARKAFSEALALNGNNAGAHAGLAQVAFQQRQFDEALRHNQKSVQLAPNNAEFQINLGKTYFKLERYEEAKGRWQRALTLAPNQPVATRYLKLVEKKLAK